MGRWCYYKSQPNPPSNDFFAIPLSTSYFPFYYNVYSSHETSVRQIIHFAIRIFGRFYNPSIRVVLQGIDRELPLVYQGDHQRQIVVQ